MTTKQKLVAGLIVSVVVAAMPITLLHCLGFIGCVLTIGALFLNYRGEIKIPATPHMFKIVIAVLVVSFLLAFGVGLIKLGAGVVFWVTAIALFVPFAKRVWSKISGFLSTHKMPPGTNTAITPITPSDFDPSTFFPDPDTDESFNDTSWDAPSS
jgi:hypothetical protein